MYIYSFVRPLIYGIVASAIHTATSISKCFPVLPAHLIKSTMLQPSMPGNKHDYVHSMHGDVDVIITYRACARGGGIRPGFEGS